MADNLIFSIESKVVLTKINKKRGASYNFFKPKQLDCLKSALRGDTIGILPTGYGKSLIFEALPYFKESHSTILVISPLNSIIEEQLERYSDAVNFNDAFISKLEKSGICKDEKTEKFIAGEITYILGHPEAFISKQGFKQLKSDILQKRVTHIVVDEAHCVVQWGEGFREKFRELKMLRSLFPSAKVLALTATATVKMREEIASHLALKNYNIVDAPMDRPNIKISVVKRDPNCGGSRTVEQSFNHIFQPLIKELHDKKDTFPQTLVYTKLKWCGYGHECAVRETVDEFVKDSVAQYHSPCTKEMRSKVLKSMGDPEGGVKLLFATEAYSMGTDAPDIRRVLHAGVPGTLEMYIQEIGRAGRDGLPAHAVTYYNNSDISSAAKVTDDVRNFCTTDMCRRRYLSEHFGGCLESVFQFAHDCCDNCEKSCDCDDCVLTKDDAEMDCNLVEDEQCIENNKSPPAMSNEIKLCIEQALLDYFEIENECTGSPSGLLTTGLTEKLASDIAAKYHCFNKERLVEEYPILQCHITDNIALIINQSEQRKNEARSTRSQSVVSTEENDQTQLTITESFNMAAIEAGGGKNAKSDKNDEMKDDIKAILNKLEKMDEKWTARLDKMENKFDKKLNEIDAKFEAKFSQLKENCLKSDKSIAEIKTTVQSVETSLQAYSDQMDDMPNDISKVVDRKIDEKFSDQLINVNEKCRENIKQTEDDLHQCIKELETKVLSLEKHSRKYNLLFYGIPETSNENIFRTLKNYFKSTLGLDPEFVDSMCFGNAHRLPNRRNSPSAPIICKFLYYSDRDAVYQCADQLPKGHRILSDLPASMKEERHRLASEAYKLRHGDEPLKTRIVEDGLKLYLEVRKKYDNADNWRKVDV